MIDKNILDIAKNKYNINEKQKNNILEISLNKNGNQNLQRASFVIFTFETFKLNLLDRMIEEINNIGGKIIDYIFYPGIDEYKVIEHYKYHNPRENKNLYEYNTSFPSVGWPVVKKRFSKPLIACLVIGEDFNFNEKVLLLKGPTEPKRCNKSHLRFRALNKAFTAIHSSDDIYSVLRESILFFGENRVVRDLNDYRTDNINYKYNQFMIEKYNYIYNLNNITLEEVKYKIINLICWYLLYENQSEIDYSFEKDADLLCYIKQKKLINDPFKTLFEYIQYINGNLLIKNCEIIEEIVETIDKYGFFENDWEKNIIESELLLNFLKTTDY